MRTGHAIAALVVSIVAASCGGGGNTPAAMSSQPTPAPGGSPQPTPLAINDDAALYRLITSDEPFASYPLFPSTSEISSGRLEGAGAHPMARVRINTLAAGSLQNGRLPPGGRFADGSVIVKEVLGANLYAVMRRADGPISGAGWQWAEFRPGGAVVYSVSSRGGSCIPCHSLREGLQNDLVRTFERQQ